MAQILRSEITGTGRSWLGSDIRAAPSPDFHLVHIGPPPGSLRRSLALLVSVDAFLHARPCQWLLSNENRGLRRTSPVTRNATTGRAAKLRRDDKPNPGKPSNRLE